MAENLLVLVTGATGILGRTLATELVKLGHHVICTTRQVRAGTGNSGARYNSTLLEWRQIDLTNAVRFPQTDLVFHCAPIWLLPKQIENMRSSGASRIVAFSSTSAETKSESDDAKERKLALALREAEQRALEKSAAMSLPITIFRPTMIYGYGQDRNISTIARFIKRYRFFFVAGKADGLRQPVHVDDLVRICLAVIENERTYGKRYNVPGGETLSYRQMVGRIFAGLDLSERIVSLPVSLYRVVLRVLARLDPVSGYSVSMANRMNQDLVFNYSEAQHDFGYAPQRFLTDPVRDLAGTVT